jgi:hypothetical protein
VANAAPHCFAQQVQNLAQSNPLSKKVGCHFLVQNIVFLLQPPEKSPALADLADQCPTQRCRELDAARIVVQMGTRAATPGGYVVRCMESSDCASNYSALRAFGVLAITSRAPLCFQRASQAHFEWKMRGAHCTLLYIGSFADDGVNSALQNQNYAPQIPYKK